MKTKTRRSRRIDPLASPAAVRGVYEELRQALPEIIPNSEKKLLSLLNAVRHIDRYPASDTRSGRPSQWPRETLLIVAKTLRKILARETSERVSISSFVGLYLRILRFPNDLIQPLTQGLITLQEATILARLSHQQLATSKAKTQALRTEVMLAHIKARGSQNSLRLRVKEILGEIDLISTQTIVTAVEKADVLLSVDPEDKRHLFYEQIKNLFYAMREIAPEDIDDKALTDFSKAADQLSTVIFAIQQKGKHRKELIGKFFT
jgi:hypothetical protein